MFFTLVFSSIFAADPDSIDINNLLKDNSSDSVPMLNQITITREEVMKAIDDLSPNKTPGPDQIYSRTLKECKTEIATILTNLFNDSLDNGIVPDSWKEGNITPIFKSSDKSDPNCYRGISLTSLISKLLETIIKNKMVILKKQ